MERDEFSPWNASTAAAVRATADDLITGLRVYAEAIAAGTSDADVPEMVEARDRLIPLLLACEDAQFEHTGTTFPFASDFDEDDEEDGEDEDAPVTAISVLQRHDYRVVDAAEVMSSGRRAYLRIWREDGEDAAAADVTHLGRALYQIAHADGWRSLEDVDGLEPTGGVVLVVRPEKLLGAEDDWPDDPFSVEAEVLYSQHDVWGPPPVR